MNKVKLFEEWKFWKKNKVDNNTYQRRPNRPPEREPEFSDGIRNWGHDKNEGWVYSFFTEYIIDNHEGHRSFKNDAIHHLCRTKKDLEDAKIKYAVGEEYEGSEIVDFMISKESEGMGTN